MFGGEGKEIISPNPGFPIYESVINYSGAKPVPIKLDFLNAWRYSPKNKVFYEAKRLFLKVKSLSFPKAQK